MSESDYVRLYVTKDDYSYIITNFGHGDAKPAKGILIKRMRERIEELEEELAGMS